MTGTHVDGTEDTELTTFVHRWAASIAANDVEHMATFVTDDWVLIDVGGQVSAAEFHGAVSAGVLRHDTMIHEVTGIKQLSESVAVITTRCKNTGWYQGRPMSADEWTTDVVIRTTNGWRCVLTQLTPRRQAES